MTAREIQICRAILKVLHDQDGAPQREILLHGEVNLIANCSLSEFRQALSKCDTNGWLVGTTKRITGERLWAISDFGETALIQLSE